MKKKQYKRTPVTVAKFLSHRDIYDSGQVELLPKQPRPAELCGRKVPENLNDMTFEQYIELSAKMKTDENCLYMPAELLLGIPRKEMDAAPVAQAFGYARFVLEELKRIGEMFKAIQVDHSPEEKQAGVESLNFGVFGSLDYYALRMGMHTHDEAGKTKWPFVYLAMKKDAETANYQRRLSKIYAYKANAKRQRK